MYFFTSVYGEKYVPFLRAFICSLRDVHNEFDLTVLWDDIPELELGLLQRSFPRVGFVHKPLGVVSAENVHQRIPTKLRHWVEFLTSMADGADVVFLDADTLVMADLRGRLPQDVDVIFTWKVERFVLNTGVVLLRNSPGTRRFMEALLLETENIIADGVRLQEACQTFGAADQRALANLVRVADYTSRFERDFGAGTVRFSPAPCAELNQTNSRPISEGTSIYHLKSGWHSILLEDGPYSQWRTEEDCSDLYRHWTTLDTDADIAAWRLFVLDACERYRGFFPKQHDAEYVERGILNSEMLTVIALIHELRLDVIIESGRYLGHSTKVLAEAVQGTNCLLHSTELNNDEVAAEAERRLAPYSNLRLHYGDAAEVIPAILEQEKGKRIGILLDGPKGADAFSLLSDAFAKHDNVLIGFVHDLRDSHPGMLNPNRVIVHEWFERIFFTDDEEFVAKFGELDTNCIKRGLWEPGKIVWKTVGSYGPTLGVIGPTRRDRCRARRRLKPEAKIIHSGNTSQSHGGAVTNNPLRRLHRIPGYTTGKLLIKRGLGLSLPSKTAMQPVVAAGDSNDAARKKLAEVIQAGPGDIIIDCGANIGQEVEGFANSGAMIYAFEPNPYAFEKLAKRFQGYTNIVCFPFAVLDREDTVRLYLHEFSEEDQVKWSVGSSLLEFKGNVDGDRYVEVPAIDLSEFIYRLVSRVKLLKMDIEGAEYETLMKIIRRGLASEIDHIVVETHEKKIPELAERHAELVGAVREFQLSNVDLGWV